MTDNESFKYHVQSIQVEQVQSAESALITLERAQKLDLLIHLIANLRQSLAICGPNGIGKTVLLSELRSRKSDVWPMVTIRASSNLSFESIQDQLLRFLMQNYTEYNNQALSSILTSLDKQNQKIIVVIDDAGLLVPGLITSLIQYAGANDCLRVIFALTHDELHIKSSSDRVIDDCHFIEIPPLTEKQCGTFLQNLSSQPDAVVPFNAINDKMIAQLYKETHGIPGNIMTELPKMSNYKVIAKSRLGGVILFAAIVTIVVGYFMFDESNQKTEQESAVKTLLMENAEIIDIVTPVINSVSEDEAVEGAYSQVAPGHIEDILTIESTNIAETELVKQDNPVLPQAKAIDNEQLVVASTNNENNYKVESVPVKSESKLEPVVGVIAQNTPRKTERVVPKADVAAKAALKPMPMLEKLQSKKAVLIKKDDSQWVLKQPKGNYTIQLIVLSQKRSMAKFMKNNLSLKESLKYFQINKQGQAKFVLIYGSFKNAKIAADKMRSLPVKYRKSWVRRFKDLQKEIK